MKFSHFESLLEKKIAPALSGVTPGVQLQVHQAGKKIADLSVGTVYPYYDLASLTKVIFTVQTFMRAFDEQKWNLKSKVRDFLGWFQHDTLIVDLLTHSSGLVWWMPLYEQIALQNTRLEKWSVLAETLRSLELQPQDKSVYSDVGFLTLGLILESMYDRSLDEVWLRTREIFYSATTLNFHIDNQTDTKKDLFAPTEICKWRGRLLQGEVHDENAWSLGGVSTHAGLFGSIDDLGWYAQQLRAQYLGLPMIHVKSKTQKMFATRARPEGAGDWALGFMMPTPETGSSGKYFSKNSIGHTGFTGTSIWYDPQTDLSVAILSNRVFLGRENKAFAKLRPEIHNWIIESLRRS